MKSPLRIGSGQNGRNGHADGGSDAVHGAGNGTSHGPAGGPGHGSGNGGGNGSGNGGGNGSLPRVALQRHPHGRERLYRHLGRPLLGLLATLVILLASVVLVRLGNGDFSSAYAVSASFPAASAGLHPGSQVEERGVQIGSVRSIVLSHGKALVTMGIDAQVRLPRDVVATIEPQNLFGADQIAIAPPASAGAVHVTGYLTNGSRIAHAGELTELGQLFATADPLLNRIDSADLARVIGELAAAYGGQGARIARSLTTGTQLASLLSRTTTEQLAALDAFTRFTLAIAGEGPVFDRLGYDGNKTLPLFNAVQTSYAKVLDSFGTFGDRMAALLTDYRPQINTILDSGGNVTRVLLAQRQNVAQVVQGLAMYAYRFGHGSSPAQLPDGSRFGYFKTFILWSDVEHFVCGLLAPATPGLSYLEPLQHAVLGNGSPLNCTSELSSFDHAQLSSSSSGSQGGKGATGATSGHGGSSGAGGLGGLGGATNGLGGAAGGLAKGLFGYLGQPQDVPAYSSIGSYVDSLLP